MRALLAVPALLLAACAGPRVSPPPAAGDAARVDAAVERLMAAALVPGLALALIDDGRVVYQRAYGVADVRTGAPLRTDTVLAAASLTKAVFAMVVLQLVDRGVLGLDQPVTALLARPLPEYPEFADLARDPRWRRFTPRMLLSHTSGLVNWRWINEPELLDIKFDPGTRYVYSGEGLQVLQLIVEERTGEPLQALARRLVFGPLGMTDSSLTWREDFEGRAAARHDQAGVAREHQRRTRARAAGSLDTTVADYARFLAAVLRGDGLSAASAQQWLAPQVAIVSPQEFPSHWPGETDVYRGVGLAYGLGWGLYRSPLGPAFFKEGHDEGVNNLALGFRGPRRGVVLLSNSGNAEALFLPLVEALFGPTCLPWFWMGYIPFDRPELRAPGAREHPVAPCGG